MGKNKKTGRYISMGIASLAILSLIAFLLTETGREIWASLQLGGSGLRRYIESKGKLGPVIFFLLSYLQVVIAPIPGQIIYFVGGVLFGTWKGFIINHTATLLGSLSAYWLGKAFGEPLIEKLSGKKQTSKTIAFVKRNGPIFFLIAFVLPGLPDDLLCYVAGITGLPFIIFFLLSLFARIPATLTASLLGDGMLIWSVGQIILIVTALLAFVVVVIIFRKPITDFLNKLARIDSVDKDVDIQDMMDD